MKFKSHVFSSLRPSLRGFLLKNGKMCCVIFEAAKVSSPRGPECLCQWDVSFYPFHYTEIFTKLDGLLNVVFLGLKECNIRLQHN